MKVQVETSGIPKSSELSPAAFRQLARFITDELGIKMPDSKLTMVQSRLMRRVRELGLTSVEQYGEYFHSASNASEREHLINAITTNKTDFFREPDHFRYLTRFALPSIEQAAEGNGGWSLKVWSAGCSSGQEAYTLAMILSEYAVERRGFRFQILGTDVSTKVLEQARTAIYPEALVAPVPTEMRRKYLWRSTNSAEPLVRIIPELRRKAIFRQLNFMDEEYRISETFEIVFYRNVMIYFDRARQEAVLQKICRHLAPGGYLFIGHSESLAGMDLPVNPVHTCVFRKSPLSYVR